MNVQDYVQEDLCALYVCLYVCLPVCLYCTALHCMHIYVISKYVIETVKYNIRSPR